MITFNLTNLNISDWLSIEFLPFKEFLPAFATPGEVTYFRLIVHFDAIQKDEATFDVLWARRIKCHLLAHLPEVFTIYRKCDTFTT